MSITCCQAELRYYGIETVPCLGRRARVTARGGSPVDPRSSPASASRCWSSSASASTPRARFGRLRDEQAALSERNRLDSLQIVRIQQNLSTLAGTLRDMLDRTEPYPMTAWANTFARLRVDLEQAFVRERELAPVGRPAGERAQLEDANRRFWETLDRAFARAQAGDVERRGRA